MKEIDDFMEAYEASNDKTVLRDQVEVEIKFWRTLRVIWTVTGCVSLLTVLITLAINLPAILALLR